MSQRLLGHDVMLIRSGWFHVNTQASCQYDAIYFTGLLQTRGMRMLQVQTSYKFSFSANLLFLLCICTQVQLYQSHKHPVPTYFHRANPHGEILSMTSPDYHLKIKSSNDSVLLSETATLKVQPEILFSKDKEIVSVVWTEIKDASLEDFVGFYCPPTDVATKYLDYIPVIETGPSYKAGHGNFKVTVYNMRVPCEFRYYRYDKEHAQLVARSNLLRFHGGHSLPLQGHISLTGNPKEMRVMWLSGSGKVENLIRVESF